MREPVTTMPGAVGLVLWLVTSLLGGSLAVGAEVTGSLVGTGGALSCASTGWARTIKPAPPASRAALNAALRVVCKLLTSSSLHTIWSAAAWPMPDFRRYNRSRLGTPEISVGGKLGR